MSIRVATGNLHAVPAELHAAVTALLRGAGQRYTAGRPLSLPEILDVRPGLPQSSVYRNLAGLEQAGAVRRVTSGDEFARFELSEELTAHHHHLVCTSCGTVTDVAPSPRLERTVERALAEIAADTGFRPEAHRLDFVGRCADCA